MHEPRRARMRPTIRAASVDAAMKILIAYASRHGSTAEVAEAIAATLGEQGHDVEVRPADAVADLAGYDGVVLGGALYMGRLHRDARQFLARYRAVLATAPFAVFAMGPGTLERKDVEGSRRQLEHALKAVREVEPRAVAIFGGVIDPAELHFPMSRMPAVDARDWDAIRAWAGEVSARFAPARGPIAASPS
jgi:menaquinone-dependent protoporphyrinogen oxidase